VTRKYAIFAYFWLYSYNEKLKLLVIENLKVATPRN